MQIYLQLFFILVLLIILVLLLIWMWTGIRAKVPFIAVPNSVIIDIQNALGIKDGSVVYDLGCGDARVLFRIADVYPNARYIGIENGAFPVIVARTKAFFRKLRNKKEVEIIDADFFTKDLSDATHIFIYLYPKVMDDMLSKLEKELKPGTRLVSATFMFTLKKPIAELDLKRGKYQLARKLYIYEF
jgi:precorrin-6B methylase 2